MARAGQLAPAFAESTATQLVSEARQWTYINEWLTSRLPATSPSAVSSIERNPDTLKALLALVAHNETVDDEASCLHDTEESTAQHLSAAKDTSLALHNNDEHCLAVDILRAVETELSRDGQVALDTLANTSVHLALASPETQTMGSRVLQLQSNIAQTEWMLKRVETIRQELQGRMAQCLLSHSTSQYAPASSVARENNELQRQLKTLADNLPHLSVRSFPNTQATLSFMGPLVQDIASDETMFQHSERERTRLAADLASFEDMPADVELARSELEDLRHQLRQATLKRNHVFEGLVEKESPMKSSRR